ncbi:MAG: hypothetical protein AABY83_01610 [Pseudomonadota bacterium]
MRNKQGASRRLIRVVLKDYLGAASFFFFLAFLAGAAFLSEAAAAGEELAGALAAEAEAPAPAEAGASAALTAPNATATDIANRAVSNFFINILETWLGKFQQSKLDRANLKTKQLVCQR